MIPRVTAVQFHRFMTSGRTRPLLCGCEDDSGNSVDDFVVKLRGGMGGGHRGLLCELLGSQLASYFGIAAPEPALVMIEIDFANLVARAESKEAVGLQNSVGLNFGSRHLRDVMAWPVDKAIPQVMRQAAVNIFAFDSLVQNPDRRFSNQNLFTRGDEIFVYDHELAFSFLLDLAPAAEPWRLDRQQYLTDHVFYRQLKSKPIDLDGFALALSGLPGHRLDAMLDEVPSEWKNEELSKIEQHLRAVSSHAAEFAEEIRRRLV